MTCLDVIEEKTGDQTRKTIQIYTVSKCTSVRMVHFKLYFEKIWNFRKKWPTFRQIILEISDVFYFWKFEIHLRLILICTDVLNLMKRCDLIEWIKKWERFAWWIRKIGSKSDNVGTNG